jgi:hypothetical protein
MRGSNVLAVLLLVLVSWSGLCAQDGTYHWEQGRNLHAGICYMRVEAEQPRKMVVHGVQIDASTPGLRLHTTARRDGWVVGKTETDRQTTRDFLRQSRAEGIPTVLAINADAFSPWPAPYNQPTPTDLAGLAVSAGTVVSKASGSPSLIQRKTGELNIEVTSPDQDASDITLAVSGFALCLNDGQPIPSGDDLHPRTGLGVSQDRRYLIVAVIDGRQPASLGATTQELGRWLAHFGAYRGINMDGGGSTTLAWWDPSTDDSDKCKLLNSPVGNGVKGEQLPAELFQPTERANGNNLGVAIDPPRTTHDPQATTGADR